MTETNYSDIAKLTWGNIPEPKLLPDGSWLLRAQMAKYMPARDEDGNPQVLFVYGAKEPMSDVRAEDLDALGSNYDLGANRIFVRFYVSNAAEWDNVRKHLAKHGVEAEGPIVDTLKKVRGTEVVGYLTTRSFVDGSGNQRSENTAGQFEAVS